jgi:branched-subunit amino acid ABC-type transport system permease component
MTSTIFWQVLWTSVTFSTFYVLYAVAFSLYLHVTKIWNFAQAGFIALAYVALYMTHQTLGLPSWVSLALAIVIVVAMSCAIEWWGFRVFRKRDSHHLTFFIFSFMVAEFLIFSATLAVGTEPLSLVAVLFTTSSRVFGVMVTRWDIDSLLTTAVLLAMTWFVLTRTRPGQKLTAVADNASLAEMFRIKPERIYLFTTSICAVLIVFATWLYGTKAAMLPETSLDLILVAVIATILGGVGSVAGAAIAAIVFGIMKGFSIFVVPSIWQNTLVYYLLFLVIVLVPSGLSQLKLGRLFRLSSLRDALGGRAPANAPAAPGQSEVKP